MMKKLFICTILFLAVVTGCSSKSKPPVSVDYEWGRLEEVILGSGSGIVIPVWVKGIKIPELTMSDFVDVMKKDGGKKLDEINPEFAKRLSDQMDYLADVLEKRGVVVHRVNHFEPEEEEFVSRGSTFLYPRDAVLVIGNNIIETSLRAPFRRKEKFAIRPIVEKYIADPGVNFVSIPPASPHLDEEGPFLEGGDVLLNGNEIYVGSSGVATDKKAIDWLQKYLGPKYTVHEIKLRPDVLHLDCAMALLRPGLGIIHKEAIVGELPDSIKDWDFITVTEDEAKRLAANVLVLDEKTVIVDPENQRLVKILREKGQEVIEVPYDALSHNYGGSFRCSHHPLRRI